MSGVFVSHAFADKAFVDEFVDSIIRLGCGVPPEEIFYTSGEDTGIPAGENLNERVRKEVGEAALVVAIISPAFQSRPYCVAEMGAAWARTGALFPMSVPGMKRLDMEGVLEGLLVRDAANSAALDELHDKIGEGMTRGTDAKTWGRYKEKWLANVEALAKDLQTDVAVTPDELADIERRFEAATAALQESEETRRKLTEQIERLKEAKSKEAVAEILLPADEVERFEHLRSAAAKKAAKLPSIVREAMWFDLFQGGMPLPHKFEDPTRAERAEAERLSGLLVEDGNERLVPDRNEVSNIDDAYVAVESLVTMLNDCSEEFDGWFREEYKIGPDLRKQAVWDKLFP